MKNEFYRYSHLYKINKVANDNHMEIQLEVFHKKFRIYNAQKSCQTKQF